MRIWWAQDARGAMNDMRTQVVPSRADFAQIWCTLTPLGPSDMSSLIAYYMDDNMQFVTCIICHLK